MSGVKENNSKIEKKVDITAPLISAVFQGNLESVKWLVQSYGLSYCECGNGGYVSLFVAIQLGHMEIAEFLLEQGAKANSDIDYIDTPLHLASVKGYLKIVQLLLGKNVLVDARNDRNETPLHLAVREGYAEIVEALLNHDASMTSQTNDGSTPLLLAVEGKHEEIVEMLFKHATTNLKTSVRRRNSTLLNSILLCNSSNGEKVDRLVFEIVTKDVGHSKIIDELIDHGFVLRSKYVKGVLVDAVKKNYIKLIDSILKSGTFPSDAIYKVLLHHAVVDGQKEIVELFLKAGFFVDTKNIKGKTCLCYSLKCRDEAKSIEIIQLLLSNGADIKEAPTLLHEAVGRGFIDVCRILIKNGADINALNEENETPLFTAVYIYGKYWDFNNQIDKTIKNNILKLLLNSGADMNIFSNGRTAFHSTVLNGRTDMVSIFLEFGVDVDVCNQNNDSPLVLAITNEQVKIIEVLCKNNADMNLRRADGATPLKYAAFLQRADVIETLLKFGAVIDFNIADSDHSDFNKEHFGVINFYDENDIIKAEILKKHIIKLKAAGLDVVEHDCQLDSNFFSTFKQECTKEVTRMKTEKISPQFSLYDILVNGKELSFAKNKSLMENLKSFDFDSFPIYKNLIEGNLEISRSRLELLQAGQRTLDVLIKTSNKLNEKKCAILPLEILEVIVSYLSYRDIKSLVYCGKALKRQLSQQ